MNEKEDDGGLEICRDAAQSCLCGNLRRTARVVTRIYDRFLQPTGLKTSQLVLLIAIRILGPVPVTRLARGVQMDRTTCTRNLAALRKQGLVTHAEGCDRRTKQVALSDNGRQKLADAYPLWESAQKFMAAEMGQERMAALVEELSGVSATFHHR